MALLCRASPQKAGRVLAAICCGLLLVLLGRYSNTPEDHCPSVVPVQAGQIENLAQSVPGNFAVGPQEMIGLSARTEVGQHGHKLEPGTLEKKSQTTKARINSARVPRKDVKTQTVASPPYKVLNMTMSSFKILPTGHNIQVGDLEVHITTASQYAKNPKKPQSPSIFLNGWARHGTKMSFKCCLIKPVSSGPLNRVNVTELKAVVHHECVTWLVDMQNTEFSCETGKPGGLQLDDVKSGHFITFAEKSCSGIPDVAMRLERPEPTPATVGVCLKISYGKVDVTKAVEWFEFMRLINVTKVFTYYNKLNAAAMDVFKYYKKIGFLDLWPIHLAKRKGGKERHATRPRWAEQAYMDEVMAANDCKHRMAGFDYVIVMDMDEIIIPKPTRKNLHPTLVTALQEASVRHPKASAFSMDAHVVPPDWGKARESPLFLARFINRTSFTNYDGAMRNLRWAFSSVGVHHVRNNQVTVDKGYTAAEMPEDLYTFYHYRRCKNTWKNCTKLAEKIHDESILRYETKLVDAILALPVDDILSKEKAYVSGLKKWKKTESKRST